MARSEEGQEQAEWYGPVYRYMKLAGHLEETDRIWKTIEAHVGACTRAYLYKDVEGWNYQVTQIRLHLTMEKDQFEGYPTWC